MAAVEGVRGRVVLVTGGAVRIGRAIVLALARAGADVVIHVRNSKREGEGLCGELRDLGRRGWLVTGSLDTPEAVAGVFRDAWSAAGRLDGLVNNAAIFARRPLVACEATDFDWFWRVNALAPMLLTRLLADRRAAMSDAGGIEPAAGVVNLLDQRIASSPGGCLPYLVSKQALAAFTVSAAHELAPRVTVNGVAPGAVLAPVGPGTREPAGTAPLGRHATPEQVAAAVVFLLASPAITGQILFVDGGQHLGTGDKGQGTGDRGQGARNDDPTA